MKFSVHDQEGKYRATCLHIEDAAILCSFYGDGAKIYTSHSPTLALVWHEGVDGEARESCDHITEVVWARLEKKGFVR